MEIILIIFLLSMVITFFMLYLIKSTPEIVVRHPRVNNEQSYSKNVCHR